jgi:hypothetical protein
VYRLWRGFHGLIVNTPEVLLSLEPGWYVGNPDMDKWIILTGAHGNLRQASSYGFLMTTAGELPSVIRADQVADTLRTHEVDLLKHVR